ncbi:IncP-type conjugal transfer protein TrbI [Oryzicola mucosus]|uniref:IncP-type conjugal transfer protein TrbI n=1 Tax=Oryzicola mucosus TaxID=2767425 RepID=A0A8J6PRE1_9HYPH|nr:IncP-type conjugal transfer protein TrbI [Oryzicola mucosus]MBD0416820.1 IncP-type conjugal transfer protein TrbI [Oryzicola mucosus]
MVQSLNLGSAQASQPQSGIRRINRLPVVVAIVLVVAFIGVIFFGINSRGLFYGRESRLETSPGDPASTYADQIKRGVTDGIIGEPQQITMFQPSPAETDGTPNPFTSPPGQKEDIRSSQDLEPEWVWRARLEREQREQYLRERHRQQMARLQADDAAYDAPIALDRGKLDSGKGATDGEVGGGVAAQPATISPAGPASDLYSTALRAGFASEKTDPNNQRGKEEFFNADLKELGYLASRVLPQQSPFELKRGSVIPATLITGINSDLPGRITAQVSQNVYDSATGRRLLIPQGTKLFGRYDNEISFGQSRVLVVWTDIIFPNGSTLQLGGMAGTDVQGYGGFRDKVDRKWLQTFGSAVLIAIIGTGIDLAVPQGSTLSTQATASDATRRNFAETFGRLADRNVQKNMDVQPTMEIRPGYKFNVLVDQDIIFDRQYAG